MTPKLTNKAFLDDIVPLLPHYATFDPLVAFQLVQKQLIEKL